MKHANLQPSLPFMKRLPILLALGLGLTTAAQAANPFQDAGSVSVQAPRDDSKKPNLVELMRGAPTVVEWETQWQAPPTTERNALAEAALRVGRSLTRQEQVAQAKDPHIGGSREDLLVTLDVARHELVKHAIQTAIKQANEELRRSGHKTIEKVMVSNCSPLGDGTRDGDLTVSAEDEVREAAFFRHLANYFDAAGSPNLSPKLSELQKGQGQAFSIEGLEITFHRGQNDVPPPHVPEELVNFSLKYRKTVEKQFENPEAYLGFGFEQEVQGRRELRLKGKKPAQVLVQTFGAGPAGSATYSAHRFTNQKQALDALRTTLGPDYTRAHNAMHAFCDFIQASHHQHETDQDISKGPVKYAERALNAICRLHGFEEWKNLPDAQRAQVLQLALGPGFSNPQQLTDLARRLTAVFGKTGQKIGDSAESAVAMSLLRRVSARALQEVARVMMDPPPTRPPNIPPERWNSLNRQEQETLARSDPGYRQRVSVAAMENLVVATRLLAQIDMEQARHGPASPFGTMALRRVIEESASNPRLQKVLQLAADHAQADAAIERSCPPGTDPVAWARQRRETIRKRDQLRFELSQECAAFRDSPDRAAVEKAMKSLPRELLKKCNLNLIPPDLDSLQARRLKHAQLALGGEDPQPALWRAAQHGKNAATWALSHAADPNNLPDLLSLVEMMQDGAGGKDYARFLIRNAAGRYNAVVGYAVGLTEASMARDPVEQEKQLAELGKGIVFEAFSRYIPFMAQAKLAFDIEKGLVNVTYGYAIKQLNNDLVNAIYLGEAGRTGPGRAGTLGGWVRDAVDPVMPETYVLRDKDEKGKPLIAVDCVRLYHELFRSWTGRDAAELDRITDLKPGSLKLARAHDRLVRILEAHAEGMAPGWFTEYSVGLYSESELDKACRELTEALDPWVRPMVTRALNSIPNVRQYTEKRGNTTVNLIEEGLVGRLTGDWVCGVQSEWNTLFMKQRQLRGNLDALMSTAVTTALAQELASPALRLVPGKPLPRFALEIYARTPDNSLRYELDGNRPLPLVCRLTADGQMPDDAPEVQFAFQTGDLIPVPASYRPYQNAPAGDFPVADAQKDPSLWSNGVFRQPLTARAILAATGQVIAQTQCEVIVRFNPRASLQLTPAAAQAVVGETVKFQVQGTAIPAQPWFEWDMGDGAKPRTEAPEIQYRYSKEGNYKVSVKLHDGSRVYVGSQPAPILAQASASAAIRKDDQLKHYIAYHDDDPRRPAHEYYYREGERRRHLIEGEEKRWFENGQFQGRMTYRNGVPDGPFEMFHTNGNRRMVATMKAGKASGPSVEYHENGQKLEEGAFLDDRKVGLWQKWDEFGRLTEVENYNSKHQLHGTCKYWTCRHVEGNPKGVLYLSAVREYVNDELVASTTYREDGSIESQWRK